MRTFQVNVFLVLYLPTKKTLNDSSTKRKKKILLVFWSVDCRDITPASFFLFFVNTTEVASDAQSPFFSRNHDGNAQKQKCEHFHGRTICFLQNYTNQRHHSETLMKPCWAVM